MGTISWVNWLPEVVTTSAISTASVMAVFPKIAGIFASAFTTLTDAYKKGQRKW